MYRSKVASVLAGAAMLTFTPPGLDATGLPDAAAASQLIVPYSSSGYLYSIVPYDGLPGFEQPGFDDSTFAVGAMPFGFVSPVVNCPLDSTVVTPWTSGTDLLVRRAFEVPAGAGGVQVAVAIDNQVQVFVNGVDISGGLQSNENCAARDRFVFSVPASVLASGGPNLLAIRARDLGDTDYLDVEIRAVPPPPANDAFANAKAIGSLPFDDSVADTAPAGTEAGEPTPSCAFGQISGTLWYAYTATSDTTLSANASGSFSTVLAAYTGSSITTLSEVGCRSFGSLLSFRAIQGTTYYFQVGGLFGQTGSVQFHLDVAPDPIAAFFYFPSDPSIFDQVQFIDTSFDPAGIGVESQSWSFGDGTTSVGCCPTHGYSLDGDYTVQLTSTTFDGRSGSASQVVLVKTHDVSITKFLVPGAASAGQTRQITVGVNNQRYAEIVEVNLYRSTPSGFQFVGQVTQSVPVRQANRTTDFAFSYMFTNDDATIGKVTFEAVATIIGARDALPADNQAIASPTKVRR